MAIEYENIIYIEKLTDHSLANKFIELNWVLITVFVSEYGISPTFTERNDCYILGWYKQNGEIQYPEGYGPTAIESWINSLSAEQLNELRKEDNEPLDF